ncbi:MAG: hypothetical protein Q4P15_07235 [Propionibacteriaceae bacterium]|nr:hypothetical protein [Propionibacteriaceae bacterium]
MDPQQFLTELDSELRSVIGEFLTTTASASDVAATDESGRVSVILHPDRTLARVQVAAGWEEDIESLALAGVIVEVAGRAQTGAQVSGEDEAVDVDPEDVDEATDALLREQTQALLAPISAQELQRQIDELPALLERLDAQLDVAIARTSRTSEDELPTEEPSADEAIEGEVVESENRMVSVRHVAGHLAEVRIKESWLAGRSGLAVTECFNQIVDRMTAITIDMEPR